MNAPRELGPDFRSWMDDGPPMPADLPERTLRQTRHTRQRRRWLWFLPAREPTAGVPSGHDRLPPTVPMKTTPIGGLMMISPTKLIAAATKDFEHRMTICAAVLKMNRIKHCMLLCTRTKVVMVTMMTHLGAEGHG